MAALEKRLTAKPDPAMEQSPTLPPPKIPQQAEPVALPPPPPTGSRRLKSKPLNFETFYASLWQEFYRIRPAVSVEGGHLPELPQEFFQALAEAVQTSNPSQRTSALELIRLLFSGCANIQLARFLNNHDLHMHNTDLFCLYLDGLLAGGLPRQVWAAGYTYLNRNRDLFSARLVFRRLRRAAISLRIPALRWREEQGIESLLGMIRRRPSSIPSLSVLVGDL